MVRDKLTANGRHRYVIRYHLSPFCTAVADGNRVLVGEPNGRWLTIVAFGNAQVQARIARSWVSRCYGRREPALVAGFEVEASGTQEFTTFIIPSPRGQIAFVDDQVVGDSAARAFQITSGSNLDVALIADDSQAPGRGHLSSSSDMAWCRFVNGKFVRARVINGSCVESGEDVLLRSIALIQRCSTNRGQESAETHLTAAERVRAVLRDGAVAAETAVRTGRSAKTIALRKVARLTEAS
jgi:hypothetical protein